MKTARILAILVLAPGVMVVATKPAIAAPMGSAFTYQGRLIDANEPADGLYDLQLKLYDSPAGGTQVGSTLDANEVDVNDGYFALLLDFGSAAAIFNGSARWLEIGVREGALDDPNVYIALVPRQELTPTPYALYAANAPGGAVADNDWKVTGTNMFSMPVGNVGIGTTTPSEKLDVKGDAKVSGEIYEGATKLTDKYVNEVGPDEMTGSSGSAPILKVTNSGGTYAHGIMAYSGMGSNSWGIYAEGRNSGGGIAGIGNGWHGVYGECKHAFSDHAAIHGYNTAGGWAGYFRGKGYFQNNVGIGTTSPADTLDVNGDIRVRGADIKDAGGTSRITLLDNGNLYLREDGGSVRMSIDTAGDVGIGTTTPDADLEVEDSAWEQIVKIGMSGASNRLMLGSGNSWAALGGGSGSQRNDIVIKHSDGYVGLNDILPQYRLELPNAASASGRGRANAWVTYSSVRWKKNIQPIEDALDKVQSLRGVRFDWKEDGKADIGMVAEEVGEILPELVDYEDNGVDAKALDYGRLVALLIEAVKEQQDEISNQHREISKQQDQIAKQQDTIAILKKAVAQNELLTKRLDVLEIKVQQQQSTLAKEVQQ